MNLTTAQQQLLDTIVTYQRREGHPPSIRQLQDALRLSSPGTVHKALRKLVEAGAIRRDAERNAIEIVMPTVPPGPRRVRVHEHFRRVGNLGIGEDGTAPLWDDSGRPSWA